MQGLVSDRLRDGMAYAIKLHGRDARKCSPVPYLAHLFGVCALVQGDGDDEDEAIAALLHDAVEDKPDQTTAEEIGKRFGKRVRDLVLACSDSVRTSTAEPKAPWKERKRAYLLGIGSKDPTLLRVSVADKVDNARAILADHRRLGDQVRGRFNAGKESQLWYFRSLVEAYRAAGVRSWLLDELARLVCEMEIAAQHRTPSKETAPAFDADAGL